MTEKFNDGGQAFPTHPTLYAYADQHLAQGMSLRDAIALQAPITIADVKAMSGFRDAPLVSTSDRSGVWALMAMLRYEYADAMLAARQRAEAEDA